MKTTKELHEDKAEELKKTSGASVDAHVEGEIRDEDAKGVIGGYPPFRPDVKSPKGTKN